MYLIATTFCRELQDPAKGGKRKVHCGHPDSYISLTEIGGKENDDNGSNSSYQRTLLLTRKNPQGSSKKD
jgi:hypothetical protein